MPPTPSLEPSLDQTYAAERAQLILTRLRWSTVLGLIPIAVSALLNVLFLDDRLGERLATMAVQAAICEIVFIATRFRAAERFAGGLAALLLMALGTSLFWSLSLSPADLDVLVCPIVAVLVGSTLLYPWGVGMQAVVSAYIVGGYLLLPPWSTLEAGRIVNVLIGLGLGGVTSVVGAWMLDRQRRATFLEGKRVAAFAAQREQLLEAGRELNRTVELPALFERITFHSRALVESDIAALILLDQRRKVFRVAAVTRVDEGEGNPERHQAILGLELPEDDGRAFVDELVRRRMIEVPGGGPVLAHVETWTARFGIARTLFSAIVRGGQILGFLVFAQRRSEPAFDEARTRLAEGIAHQAAIALANARLVDDLQTASRIRTEFVSTMSHELRTPLNVILGYAEIARDHTDDAERRTECIDRIEAAGRDLLELIESTLEVGRIEAGRDEVKLERVALDGFWGELGQGCARMPRTAGVRLEWRGDPPHVTVVTDPRKLTIVMRNLVSNALKFTSTGEVRGDVFLEGETVVLRVSDTGIGIPPEDHETIFEMFRQGDSSDTRRYGGTGLGLYLVRRFVQQLGGQVSLDSAPGRGSTFTVRIRPPASTTLRAA